MKELINARLVTLSEERNRMITGAKTAAEHEKEIYASEANRINADINFMQLYYRRLQDISK